ncbi:MAG: domain S-box/diguanylate cyclase protein [Paenibacillus sp.]|nr:domain S-box/diguanylate cyclase protein [Paenibacillus sp.]
MPKHDDTINILLVDDRPENLLALEAIIERDDFHLVKALSGEEALKYLLKHDFAVILLDVQMPKIDGYATAKIIKDRERTKHVPIIFVTANQMDAHYIFAGYAAGAVDYILKPFDPGILKAKVEVFVELYKMNQRLVRQADILAAKTRELEVAYKGLTELMDRLGESEALANVISETSIDAMLVADKDGIILKANPSVRAMFQYSEMEITGQPIQMLFAPETSQAFMNPFLQTLHSSEGRRENDPLNQLHEVTAARRDGTCFPAEIQLGKQVVKDKYIVACTIRDITKKKRDQELIAHMAYHDGLTDLPNKRLFTGRLNEMVERAKLLDKTLALIYLDMDRFKYVNDSLGHLMGDRLLQDIAARLKVCAREGDFVARIGGDEFNIILPDTNREQAIEMAEQILEAFRHPFYMDSYEILITTSIGISVFPYDGEEPLVLTKNADAALYRAKEKGKNKYNLFHSGLSIRSYRAFVLQNDLWKTIERGELALVYQPQLDIRSETAASAEALLRWNHPQWGLISPMEFIPLAEETGYICEIGEWVLRAACVQCRDWQMSGLPPIRVSVNFSAQQFLQKDLVSKIRTILEETNVSPVLLEIEITESTLIEGADTIAVILNQLRALGIRISIDDFGMGYSSLQYLRQLPIHTLKIDKSFIQNLTPHPSDGTALVTSIIGLAHSLHMQVVAEGVETEEQLVVLKNLDCEVVQGYFYSPPLAPLEFEAFMSRFASERSGRTEQKLLYFEKNNDLRDAAALCAVSLSKEIPVHQESILDAALIRTRTMYGISFHEMEVFKLIIEGLSNKEISDKLFISERMVKHHIARIFHKLSISDRLQAVGKVYQACIEESSSIRAD